MIHAMSSTEALSRRHVVVSPGTGIEHWGTEFFGPRSSLGVQSSLFHRSVSRSFLKQIKMYSQA